MSRFCVGFLKVMGALWFLAAVRFVFYFLATLVQLLGDKPYFGELTLGILAMIYFASIAATGTFGAVCFLVAESHEAKIETARNTRSANAILAETKQLLVQLVATRNEKNTDRIP